MRALHLYRIAFILGVFSLFSLAEAKEKDAQEHCPGGNRAITVPAPVNISSLMEAITNLKTKNGKPALNLSQALVRDIHEVFDTNIVKTKMEQFYSLLYVLQAHLSPSLGKKVDLGEKSTRTILLRSKVFTDPEIPKHIIAVSVDRTNWQQSRYHVVFDQERTIIPLNKGEGFYLFRNGLCQHAIKLIFQKHFYVSLKKNRRGNIVARDFKGVDLYGKFGNRGFINVDINYVEFRSVEFFRGTPNGKVTVYVSKEEFRQNDHNPLLRIITRIVPDRSVQPIDW